MKLLLYLFTCILIGVPSFFYITSLTSTPSPLLLISPLPLTAEVLGETEKESTDELQKIVMNELVGTKGTYGIYIKHLQKNEIYMKDENRVFDTASLYKLWIMSTTYEQIKNRTLTEETVMNQTIPVLNRKFNIASEEAELVEGDISLSVRDALNKMITVSDNYAALLLTEKVKISNVTNFLKNNGFTVSKVGQPPKTIPVEIGDFLEKIYNGELVSKDASDNMLSLLLGQRLRNKLPKYLPTGTRIAHKTGELGQFTHDAGIVYTEKGDYIIVIMSQSTSPLAAEERIANISRAVYQYFTK